MSAERVSESARIDGEQLMNPNRVWQRTLSVSSRCRFVSSSSCFASFPPCSQPIVSTGAIILDANERGEEVSGSRNRS